MLDAEYKPSDGTAVDAMHARMVWTHKGMTNWYRNRHDRVFAITPWRLVDYRRVTAHFDPAEYELSWMLDCRRSVRSAAHCRQSHHSALISGTGSLALPITSAS